MIEVTNKTEDLPVCEICDCEVATHCTGVAEYNDVCQKCLAKMSQCAEENHSFQRPRIMYSRVRAYKWLRCSRCWYNDLEPMYGVPAPQFLYKHQQVICDGKNYLPLPPMAVF